MEAMAFEDEIRKLRLQPFLFMESVWRDLPWDILQRVFSFLPIAALCRLRAVSKKCNCLISHPDFALRHAQAIPPEEYVFLTLKFDAYESNPIRGWEVLDVVNKRFFTLSNDFLTEYAKREGIVPASLPPKSFNERAVLAADGGLFCVSYSTNIEQSSVLLVCNPVLKAVKQLPEMTGWVAGNQMVLMKTDRVLMEYKIFVAIDPHHQDHRSRILIYESKAGKWRTVPNSPPPSDPWNPLSNRCNSVSSSFKNEFSFLKKEFYDPFPDSHPSYTGVISDDKVSDALSEVHGVDWPIGEPMNLHLVMSNDQQLFFVITSESVFLQTIAIELSEIILARRDYIPLTEMSNEMMSLDVGDEVLHGPFVAIWCENSILICSISGRTVAYSLSNKSWDQVYPHNNLPEALFVSDEPLQEVYGSNYCISLFAP
ncbi:hypothetical protein KC19_3G060400 [Ceratodon purpureus]|uniref:F-box domain-containing protein n=1 Tax=Ceratodon purpureus TaxID=3225 RepID=A0A8T0IHF9_CERPU|nr:hypothetical protein KC19_3G060400 [Ceratodon purpureus]